MWILQNGHNHENSQCTTMVRSMLGNVHLETMCMLSASLFLVEFVFLKVFCVAFFNHCCLFVLFLLAIVLCLSNWDFG